MTPPILLGVPNASEGRDRRLIDEIAQAMAVAGPSGGAGAAIAEGAPEGVRLLDVHSDRDHHRSVFTLAAWPGVLADALLRGAAVAVERIDVMARGSGDPRGGGQHPHVGALDVAPVVYLENSARGVACAEALVVADRIGEELGVPVFLYGELTSSQGSPPRSRAELRRGGVSGLQERMGGGGDGRAGLRADFGPHVMHPTAGATLVAAREPLVAFNLLLEPPATVADASRIAGLIREGGADGLPGLRAMGVAVDGGVGQVSINVERPLDVPLAAAVDAVRRHGRVRSAEIVGLAPRAALEGFPQDVPLHGFDPARHVIENALGF